MTRNDFATFSARLVVLAELFDAKFSEGKILLYFEALSDLPLERVIQALDEAARRCSFMPKPADLRTMAIGDDEQTIELAWMMLRRAMRAVGSYSSLVVSDPVLAEVITAMFGSWPAACAAEFSAEMWASKRKEFGRLYRVMAARGLVGPRYLAGICEQANAGVKEWLSFVPVKRLNGDEIQTLTVAEAERERGQIAATSHGFKRLADGEPLAIQPATRGETA